MNESIKEIKKEIKVIIAGSRSFDSDNNYLFLKNKMNILLQNALKNRKQYSITIISGTANGADQLGERYANEYCLELIKIPAQWDIYGKRAGMVRNVDMAKIGTHCVVFRVNESKGSTHMIETAKYHGLITRIYDFESKRE
jgi:hypothetical protein